MIYKSAYDTLMCRDFVMTKITHGVEEAIHSGQVHSTPTSALCELTGGMAMTDAIPAFTHPLVIEDRLAASHDHTKHYFTVADMRAFGKFDPHKAMFVVRNRTEYEFAQLRGRLASCWVKESPVLLLNVNPLGMKMFSAWISTNVTKKFLLDPRESATLQTYAAFFYYCLFTDAEHFTPVDKHKIMATIQKATGITASIVADVVDHFEKPLSGVEEFCKLSQEVVQSIRLAALNVGMLFALLGNTWFGSNKNEIVAVALEHPPTWLAMIAMASQDRSYKNSPINRLLETLDRKDKGQTLYRAIHVTLDAAGA
jgi:hypothetical protein